MSTPLKEGWGTKLGGFIKNWKRRWFVLDGKNLRYYKTDEKTRLQGTIDLTKVSKIEPFEACKKPYAFTISILNGRVYQISCENETELESWLTMLNATSEPPIRPTTVDDFELLKVIGRGTFGKVQLVQDKRDGQIYAMKSLSKAKLVQQHLIGATVAERDMLLKLSSPFLLSMKYTFQSESKAFFVTPYLQGGELLEQLNKEGSFSEDRIVLYIAMIALGIQCLHDNHIMHRDIKPENVLFNTDGYLVITDFGLVKDMSDGSYGYTFCGSPLYLAPEIIRQYPYSFEVDWWALGIIAFEMYYGYPPFYDENVKKMYTQIVSDPPVFDDEVTVSPDAVDFLRGVLEKDPGTRLGHNGVDDLKKHKLFANVDWEKLAKKEYQMSWKPDVKSPTDVGCFDEEVTHEPVAVTYEAPSGVNIEGFTACQPDILDQ